MKISARKTATFVASTIAGMAAGTLTSMVLKQNTEAVKVSEKVAQVVGSFVIGALVQDQAEKYIEGTCDQIFDFFEGVKDEMQKPKEQIISEESE